MTEYAPVIDIEVVAFLAASSKSIRGELLAVFDKLRNNPFQKGEFADESVKGRPVHVKRFGRWRVSYWPDHGACEIRIVEIRLLKLKRGTR